MCLSLVLCSFNNTDTVGEQLQLHGVNSNVPLVLATSWSQASQPHLLAAIASLQQRGYKVDWGLGC